MSFEFLIVGCGRGGTTLPTGMLDYHPKLRVDIEYMAKETLLGPPGGEPPEKVETILQDRSAAFLAACEARAADSRRQIYGNKVTTEMIHALEDHNRRGSGPKADILEHFFGHAMAGRKIIHVLRDGRATVRSKIKRKGMTVEQACRHWRYSLEVRRHLFATRDELHELRFEDLIRDPEGELTRVCEFIGVGFDDEMLSGTANESIQPDYRQRGIDRSTLDLTDLPDGVEDLLRPELEELGYL